MELASYEGAGRLPEDATPLTALIQVHAGLKKCGLSQDEVARRLKISNASLSQALNGKGPLPDHALEPLATLSGVNRHELAEALGDLRAAHLAASRWKSAESLMESVEKFRLGYSSLLASLEQHKAPIEVCIGITWWPVLCDPGALEPLEKLIRTRWAASLSTVIRMLVLCPRETATIASRVLSIEARDSSWRKNHTPHGSTGMFAERDDFARCEWGAQQVAASTAQIERLYRLTQELRQAPPSCSDQALELEVRGFAGWVSFPLVLEAGTSQCVLGVYPRANGFWGSPALLLKGDGGAGYLKMAEKDFKEAWGNDSQLTSASRQILGVPGRSVPEQVYRMYKFCRRNQDRLNRLSEATNSRADQAGWLPSSDAVSHEHPSTNGHVQSETTRPRKISIH
jgi:transcriptional regulator with XRE-family HTH domain